MSLGTIDEDTRQRKYRPSANRHASYSDEEKATALEVLAANDGRITQTADMLGIARITLADWKRQAENGTLAPCVQEIRPIARKMLDAAFEEEAYAALAEASLKRGDANYQQLITGAAISVDKMRLLREQATSIHTQQLSDEERIARLNELLATALTLPASAAEEQSEEQPALPASALEQSASAHEQPDADDCT